MKLFFKPNGIKISLFISFILFLPTLVYFGAAGGYVPPSFILFFILVDLISHPLRTLTSSLFWIALSIFVVTSAIHYLISCVCYKIIFFMPNKKVRKLLITSIIICLVMLAIFCKIYYFGDVQGGVGAFRLLEILREVF